MKAPRTGHGKQNFFTVTFPEFTAGLSIIASLVLIEGLLSVDNVLGIAAIARSLPEAQRKRAIRLGMAGAYLFRVIALIFVGVLKDNLWVRWLGAGYLIYLMCSQLSKPREADGPHAGDLDDTATLDKSAAAGHIATPAKALTGATFGAVLMQIGLMDLSLSVDNVIAAVALAGNTMWAIYVGVLIAILALQFLTGFAMRMLEKYPILEPTAFLLIGYVGFLLLVESATGAHLGAGVKFAGIISILLLVLVYARFTRMQKFMAPVNAGALPVMKLFAGTVGLPFKLINWLITKGRHRLAKKTYEATHPGN